MVATSQNGWDVATHDEVHYYPVPGDEAKDAGTVAIRKGAVAIVLVDLMGQLQKLEPAAWPGLWGWFVRPIRGQTSGYSNHASATAIDWNAPKHPRQSLSRYRGWSKADVVVINKLLYGRYKSLIRWGANYHSRPYDPMHFEVVGDEKQIAALAASLLGSNKPTTPSQNEGFDMINIYRVTDSAGERWAVCSNGTRWWINSPETLAHLKLMMQKRWNMPDVTEYPCTRADLDAGFYGIVLPGSPVPPKEVK